MACARYATHRQFPTILCLSCAQGSSNNSLCFTGPYRSFDPVTKAFTAFRAGAGHWGPDARPGVSALPIETSSFQVSWSQLPLPLPTRLRPSPPHPHNPFVCNRTRAGVVARPSRCSRLGLSGSENDPHPLPVVCKPNSHNQPSFRDRSEQMLSFEQAQYIGRTKI